MDYARNYRDTAHSIKTEEKLRFDMETVISDCGSAGCIIGHAVTACMTGPEAQQVLANRGHAWLDAANLLNLSDDAAHQLFYTDVAEKNSPFVAGIILRELAPIAEERQVESSDVDEVTAEALRAL